MGEAFRAASSYPESVERAVALGEDTDTTAAVAGGLAGVYRGVGGGPAVEWLTEMRGRDIVEPLIARLVAAASAKEVA